MTSGLRWRWAQCPPSGCWSARSPDLWSAIAIGAAVAIAAGYVGFGSLGQAWPPRLQAFGAGALLAMAAETMIPEAFHNSPRFSGLLTAFGFGLLLLVDATTR